MLASGCGRCDGSASRHDAQRDAGLGDTPLVDPVSAHFNAFEGCLLGAPVVDRRRAASRLRVVQIAVGDPHVLGSDAASAPANRTGDGGVGDGGAAGKGARSHWPARCAKHADSLIDALLDAPQRRMNQAALGRLRDSIAQSQLPPIADMHAVWRDAAAVVDRDRAPSVSPQRPDVPATIGIDAAWQLPGTKARQFYGPHNTVFAHGDPEVLATYPTNHVCSFTTGAGPAPAGARCQHVGAMAGQDIKGILTRYPGGPTVYARPGVGYFELATGRKLLSSDATWMRTGASWTGGGLAVLESSRLRLRTAGGKTAEIAIKSGQSHDMLVGNWFVWTEVQSDQTTLFARNVEGGEERPPVVVHRAPSIQVYGRGCAAANAAYITVDIHDVDGGKRSLVVYDGVGWQPPVAVADSQPPRVLACTSTSATLADIVSAPHDADQGRGGLWSYIVKTQRCTKDACEAPAQSAPLRLRARPVRRFATSSWLAALGDQFAVLYVAPHPFATKPISPSGGVAGGLRMRLGTLEALGQARDQILMNTDHTYGGLGTETNFLNVFSPRSGGPLLVVAHSYDRRALALRIASADDIKVLHLEQPPP